MALTASKAYSAALQRVYTALDLSALCGTSVLVTGSTGMLGSCLVDALMQWNAKQAFPCRVIVSGRNEAAARARFTAYRDCPNFSFIRQDIIDPLKGFPDTIDYIVHAASYADPVNFSRFPVDTLLSNVVGTDHLLQYGIAHGMMRFLYVSSGEMYGQPLLPGDDFTEDYCGAVDHSNARSCYPAGKRAGEVLCQAYVRQYGSDAVIVRPCHLFGPTMTASDSRAASEFLRNAADGRDILLKSAGLVERSHCYVMDAVRALLLVLLSGKCGEAYNIADKVYQMRIRDFAEKAASAGGCRVMFANPNDLEAKGYSTVSRAVLDNAKLIALGWSPGSTGIDAIRETVKILREVKRV